ncbi:hypothetical protein HGRIS_003949 [Hohenbuehelia grisea]|uniref:Indoleamine 2,3-dioxygenase n=1 Tax=Hohenbuehelia grisea TaxID=104357 RepID=A0ABR3JHC5_9AGAR
MAITDFSGHDYHVDTKTGFMPPRPPPASLPPQWAPWEAALSVALERQMQPGDKPGLTEQEKAYSERWRARIREMPILSTAELMGSEVNLRRAHHTLTFLAHFYIHSLPPDAPILIPPPITLPLLQVSAKLQMPPVLTFSDNVLYNWELKDPRGRPTVENIRSQDLFTGLSDEEEFYLCSARIELRGVEALELMRSTMEQMRIGDEFALRRISTFLHRLAEVIKELKTLLLAVRDGCDPETYYTTVRPWFRGQDSDPKARRWVFQGIERDPSLIQPTELSGPSAGQSSIVHVLDLFLGIQNRTASGPDKPAFLTRMQSYMPRHHRAFLDALAAYPHPLREFVQQTEDPELLEAYNAAVLSLKEFRDSHMIIATLYIISPARRAAKAKAAAAAAAADAPEEPPLKGTGGTDLVKFLKDTRDRTRESMIPA